MPTSRFLTLIATEIAPSLAQAMAAGAERWPKLARVAGRGTVALIDEVGTRVRDLSLWQESLLDALGLRPATDRYPSAAVTRSGELGEPASGFWMHASPIHMAAGLDHLAAVPLQGDSRITDAERNEIEPSVAAHIAGSDFEFLRTSTGHWLVRSERVLQVATTNPGIAARGPLENAMPHGRDAPQLRRLMTELQMLLHEHPVNVLRTGRGLNEINAIWFHGSGTATSAAVQVLPQAWGADPYLHGIYRLNGQTAGALPADVRVLLSQMQSSAGVVLVPADDLDTLEQRWVAPLLAALGEGTLAHLDLILDRWRISLSRGALLRFWRRARPPAQWAVC